MVDIHFLLNPNTEVLWGAKIVKIIFLILVRHYELWRHHQNVMFVGSSPDDKQLVKSSC